MIVVDVSSRTVAIGASTNTGLLHARCNPEQRRAQTIGLFRHQSFFANLQTGMNRPAATKQACSYALFAGRLTSDLITHDGLSRSIDLAKSL